MTEPADVLIKDALVAQLTTPAVSAGITIAHAFAAFTPTPGVMYLDCRAMLRAENERPSLNMSGSVIRRGIFQVDVVAPDGVGETAALRLAALVAARFAIGTELVAGSYKLQILNEPTIATAVKDAPWVRFPVSIRYTVIT